MKKYKYIAPLRKGMNSHYIGNKAFSLLFLKKNSFLIPSTWVVNSKAYEDFCINGSNILDLIKEELNAFPMDFYAVRSSTLVEDSADHSYAGQFQTCLNVSGTDALLLSIQKVWESATKVYEEISANINEEIRVRTCAVIIQKMVPAKISGVCFSRNPVNNHHEIVIEAIEGKGEDLVQKGFTPLRWRLKGNKLLEGNHNFKHLDVIKEVAKKTCRISKLYKEEVDVEWAFDGTKVYFLQVRPLTAKRELPVYSSKMAKEMLPGQIKPLVWSVNIPLVNGTWIDILSKIIGQVNVPPEELAKSFYYRTYFNVANIGRLFGEFGISIDSLEYLLINDGKTKPAFRPGLKMVKHTFRILRFLRHLLSFENFFIREFALMEKIFQDLDTKIRDEFTVENYPQLYNELFANGKRLVYLNIFIPILMQIRTKRLKKELQRFGIEYDRLDFFADFPELLSLSPIPAMERVKAMIDAFFPDENARPKSYSELLKIPGTNDIINAFQDFLYHFGHISESGNDFSYEKWEENPELVFNMIINSSLSTKRKDLIRFNEITASNRVSSGLRKKYRQAGKFMTYREQISSLYTFGYGLFRKLFRRLGHEMVHKKILDDKDDIFYLFLHEIDALAQKADPSTVSALKNNVLFRKNDMEACRDLVLPTVIYGEVAPILETGTQKNYYGVGSSAGSFTGRARIIREMGDFRPQDIGAVLIIPFSDVGWTPVLLKAGAIVSEAGGMLSHCSILAREAGIPTLVSVEHAFTIPEGSLLTVDGSNGILTLHDNGRNS